MLVFEACVPPNPYQQREALLQQEARSLVNRKSALQVLIQEFGARLTPDQRSKLKQLEAFQSAETKSNFLSSLSPSQRDELANLAIMSRNLQNAIADFKARAEQLSREERTAKIEADQAQLQTLGLLLQLQQQQAEQQRALTPQTTSCLPNLLGGVDCTTH